MRTDTAPSLRPSAPDNASRVPSPKPCWRAKRKAILEIAAVCVVLAAAFTIDILARRGPQLADDGAFFLRYAENMARGYFWVWNPGQAPIWGASAPLWPLVVAAPIALGANPFAAMVYVSIAISVASFSAAAVALGRRVNFVAGVAFFAFAALDAEIVYYSAAGLESPLTVLLLTLGVLVLLYHPPSWMGGAVAGVLMINKVDLIPAGVLLLAALWLQNRRLSKAQILIPLVLVMAWYGFAWAYFGNPLPNSFMTKAFHQTSEARSINWTWFGKLVLLMGVRKWYAALALVGLIRGLLKRSPMVVFLGGVVCVDLIAYSIKYPFEPYDWYSIPAVFCLIVGAAYGVSTLRDLLLAALNRRYRRRAAVLWTSLIVVAAIGAVIPFGFGSERVWTTSLKNFAAYQEFDRAQAGRWVSAHTPKNFVVYTDWGNPAAFSNRRVIDGSFLNMPYESGDLIKKYRPNVLILENNPGSTIDHPVFGFDTQGYRIVKIFDRSYVNGLDYFFAVLIRNRDLHYISRAAVAHLFSN